MKFLKGKVQLECFRPLLKLIIQLTFLLFDATTLKNSIKIFIFVNVSRHPDGVSRRHGIRRRHNVRRRHGVRRRYGVCRRHGVHRRHGGCRRHGPGVTLLLYS